MSTRLWSGSDNRDSFHQRHRMIDLGSRSWTSCPPCGKWQPIGRAHLYQLVSLAHPQWQSNHRMVKTNRAWPDILYNDRISQQAAYPCSAYRWLVRIDSYLATSPHQSSSSNGSHKVDDVSILLFHQTGLLRLYVWQQASEATPGPWIWEYHRPSSLKSCEIAECAPGKRTPVLAVW